MTLPTEEPLELLSPIVTGIALDGAFCQLINVESGFETTIFKNQIDLVSIIDDQS